MIDLIDECASDLKKLGYKTVQPGKYSLTIGKLEVDSLAKSKELGFDKGSYFIFNCPLMHYYGMDCFEYLAYEISIYLKKLLRKHNLNKKSRVLIVGLGNPEILADSVGDKVLKLTQIDVFKKSIRIFKFAPNIFANTGINSFDVVHMLAIWQDIDAILIIDALATESVSRLATCFQINDVGMTPGSAVNNLGHKLCKDTLGVPCLSIGVPTMLLAGKVDESFPDDLILTPKDIHQQIDNVSKIISLAISRTI